MAPRFVPFPFVLRLFALPAALSALGACAPADPLPEQVREAIVFGDDDRKESYEHPSEWLTARALHTAAAMIAPGNLNLSVPTSVGLDQGVDPISEVHDLCDDVLFRDQPAAANCSGTLIDERLLLTAGHCLGDGSDCSNYAFVFNYRYEADGDLAPMDAEDIYYCRQRIVYDESDLIDHAIIELDRPVHPRHHPAPVRFEDGELPVTTPVATVSFGQGIPAKLDDNGQVSNNAVDEENGKAKYFEQTLDTFPGSSGAGVYTHDGRVAGVHVRGANSYLKDGLCYVLTTSYDDPELAIGGDASHVARAMEDLCATDYVTTLCPGDDSLCKSCDACTDAEECGTLATDPDTTYCAAICVNDGDCGNGLACDDGQCLPRPRCHAGHVWAMDACGRPAAMVTECDEDEVCKAGEFVCSAAGEGNSCASAEALEPVDQTITGTLGDDYRSNFLGSCGGLGQDRVWELELTERTRLRATATGFDTVLYLQGTCDSPASEVICRDDTTPPGDKGARLETTLDAGTYYLVLDSEGFSPRPGGDFELDLTFTPVAGEDDAAVTADAGVDGSTGGGGGSGCSVGASSRNVPHLGLWAATFVGAASVGARRRRTRRSP